jgi:hypothetical protein
LDCSSLHEILTLFNNLIFNEFKVNINPSLTLPALAMRIYKSQFMPENTIYQILGQVESDIRQSYTGGAVDVYIPHNRITGFFNSIKAIFITLYYYDVNGLYPFIMAETPMPIGKPVAFTGNIRKYEPSAFGFFYCKITSPKHLEHPILQRKIETPDGIRTIAGLGTWNSWIFSSEMDNAIKYGYSFEILKGYEFKKGNIFKSYVETLYNLRIQYLKGHPMNLIAKLLMNSLYGKFAMKNQRTVVNIFNTSNEIENNLYNEMLELYGENVNQNIQIDNFIVTVRNSLISLRYNDGEDLYHGIDINIAIASAITGGARMWMSLLKNNPLFNLYYSDTDSGVTDAPLPEALIGNKLGQFKLECTIKRAVFLAPKVYALITSDNKEIIKVKGLSKEMIPNFHIEDLENLLVKDSSREFNQSKWFKKVIEGELSF